MPALRGNTPATTYLQLLYLETAPAGGTRNVRRDDGTGGQIIMPIHFDVGNGRVGVMQPTPTQAFDVVGNIKLSGNVHFKYNAGNINGTVVLDARLGDVHELTLTGNVASFTISNPPPAGSSQIITITFVQDATGGRTLAASTGIMWEGGSLPTLTTTAGRRDTFQFYWNGANWVEISGVLDVS